MTALRNKIVLLPACCFAFCFALVAIYPFGTEAMLAADSAKVDTSAREKVVLVATGSSVAANSDYVEKRKKRRKKRRKKKKGSPFDSDGY